MRNVAAGFTNVTSSLRGGKWTAFNFWAEGTKNVSCSHPFIHSCRSGQEENCRRCPRTTALLEQHVPIVRDCSLGFVYFSVLTPGTHITPHCGPSNVRLRTSPPICARALHTCISTHGAVF